MHPLRFNGDVFNRPRTRCQTFLQNFLQKFSSGFIVVEMKEPTDVVRVLMGIHDSVNQAEAMSTDQLTTALAELELAGGEHVASLESAVKGEACHRLRHPLSWRLSRWINRIKRHAN